MFKLFQRQATMNKLEKLAGLIGREADSITAEELAAVNAELAGVGINGLELRPVNATEENPLQATVDKLTADLGAATTALATAQEEVTTLGEQVSSLQAELTKYKPDPAAAAAAAAAAAVGENGEDKETEGESKEWKPTAADEEFTKRIRETHMIN